MQYITISSEMNEWLSERTCTYHVYIIGDLDVIRNPAKYLSRLGLAFSNTEPGLTVKPQWIKREPDIKGGRDPSGKQYCFSDGIGKISVSLMSKSQVGYVNWLQTKMMLLLYIYTVVFGLTLQNLLFLALLTLSTQTLSIYTLMLVQPGQWNLWIMDELGTSWNRDCMSYHF